MLIELNGYTLLPEKKGAGHGITSCRLDILPGEVWSVDTDSANDGHLLFRGLATLACPSEGIYRFREEILNFMDYRDLLHVKKQIGYLTSGTALISNRSIRDNLCLGQAYFENDLSSTLDPYVENLCREFGIFDIINERPSSLGHEDKRSAMVIRELSKKPKIMLLEYPEKFTIRSTVEVLVRTLKQQISEGMALVFLTDEDEFSQHFESGTLEIKEGRVSKSKDKQ